MHHHFKFSSFRINLLKMKPDDKQNEKKNKLKYSKLYDFLNRNKNHYIIFTHQSFFIHFLNKIFCLVNKKESILFVAKKN